MPFECYIDKRFSESSSLIIEQANEIINEYQAQGFTLTLRQLYYQFVSRAIIPNKQTEYKRLGSIINDARLAGLIDWDAIEDRTRNLRVKPFWESPRNIINSCASQFRINKWEDQPCHVEVWIEKDALVGVIENVCEEWQLPYFACRGYTSQSEQWTAGKRLGDALAAEKRAIILHLGDHDPSGLDMTVDNTKRLNMFVQAEGDFRVEVMRLALNMDQVLKFNPPPNPAKLTDSRCAGYMAEHGNESWELDALEPRVISQLISDTVGDLVNMEAWDAAVAREDHMRARLRETAENWVD